jgi:GTP-binding protein HflX
MEKTLLVTIELKQGRESDDTEDFAEELEELACACGVEVIDNIICLIDKPTPNFFIGTGKAEELSALAKELAVDTAIFSHDLSGTQQRNLEKALGVKVIDRTQLILDIFARRAKSPEGKMQVELAQLEYLMPRLTGKGSMLSRQGAGVGTSGPGEKKLEVDRRRIKDRIARLKGDLKKVTAQRSLIRKKRKEESVPLVALVGYTSAGKSTLLNALTQSNQQVSGSLFTTLDPLARNLKLPNGERIVLFDTVGFIRGLPHGLIEAFKATLEEVTQADLLIHVLDVSSNKACEKASAVAEVLKELDADKKPAILALNKTDLINDPGRIEELNCDFSGGVKISAREKINLDLLLEQIQAKFADRMVKLDILIPHKRMDLVDLFHRQGRVAKVEYIQKGIKIDVTLPKEIYSRLKQDKDIKVVN